MSSDPDFVVPSRGIDQLETGIGLPDGAYVVMFPVDVADIPHQDQVATLSTIFHELSRREWSIAKEREKFDTLYSFVKALPTGCVPRECRAQLASELSQLLVKVVRNSARLDRAVAQIDSAPFHEQTASSSNADGAPKMDRQSLLAAARLCRNAMRMSLFLVSQVFTAAVNHAASNLATRSGDEAASSSQQPSSQPGRSRRGKTVAARLAANSGTRYDDAFDISSRETAIRGMIEALASDVRHIWLATDDSSDASGSRQSLEVVVDPATCECILRSVLAMLENRSLILETAENPIFEGLLELTARLAQQYSLGYRSALLSAAASGSGYSGIATAMDTSKTTAAAAHDASADVPADENTNNPSDGRTAAGTAGKKVVIAAADPADVLVSPLIDMLLRSGNGQATVTAAGFPRFIAKLLSRIDTDYGGGGTLDGLGAVETTEYAASQTPPPAPDGPSQAASWGDTFVHTVMEAVATASVSELLIGDAIAAKSISCLVDELAHHHISLVSRHSSIILALLHSANYEARKSAVTALAEIILQKFGPLPINAVGPAGVNPRETLRDKYVEDLWVRIRDVNPFVRCHTLKVWAQLVDSKAIPKGFHLRVAQEVVGRLDDRHFLVRRGAMQLLSHMMRRSWFHSVLSRSLIQQKHLEHLTQLESAFVGRDLTGALQQARAVLTCRTLSGPGGNLADGLVLMPTSSNATTSSDRAAAVATVDVDVARVILYEQILNFIDLIQDAMKTAIGLLNSKTVQDVVEAMNFIVACAEHRVDNAGEAVMRAIVLIFVQEPAVQDATIDLFLSVFIRLFDKLNANALTKNVARAQKLVAMIGVATEGEISAVERILSTIRQRQLTLAAAAVAQLTVVTESLLDAVFGIADGSLDAAATTEERRSATRLYSLLVASLPRDVVSRRHALLDLVRNHANDNIVVTHAFNALGRESLSKNFYPTDQDPNADPLLSLVVHHLCRPTKQVVSWTRVATAAINLIHSHFADPPKLCAAVVTTVAGHVVELANAATPGFGGDEAKRQNRLAQLCFLLGQTALKHVVWLDHLERSKLRACDTESSAAAAAVQSSAAGRKSGGAAGQDMDVMHKELGLGTSEYKRHEILEQSAAARRAIVPIADPVKMNASGQPHTVWSRYAPMVVDVCRAHVEPDADTLQLSAKAALRQVAILSLLKLMVASQALCHEHLPLVFAWVASSRSQEPWMNKVNIIIGIGDLLCSHPNELLQYVKMKSHGFFALLADPDVRVRCTAVQVCTHLVLNDMLRVKNHLDAVVRLVADPDDDIRDSAHMFVHHMTLKFKDNVANLIAPLVKALSLSSDYFQRMRNLGLKAAVEADVENDEESDVAAESDEESDECATDETPTVQTTRKRSRNADGASSSSPSGRRSATQDPGAVVVPPMSTESFQEAVKMLLGGVEKEKTIESLVEKLCALFPRYDERDDEALNLARNISWCLGELQCGERTFKRLSSERLFAMYRPWLRDATTVRNLLQVATRLSKRSGAATAGSTAETAGSAGTAEASTDGAASSGSAADRRDKAVIAEWEAKLKAALEAAVPTTASSAAAPQTSGAATSPAQAAASRNFGSPSQLLPLDFDEGLPGNPASTTHGNGRKSASAEAGRKSAGRSSKAAPVDDGSTSESSSSSESQPASNRRRLDSQRGRGTNRGGRGGRAAGAAGKKKAPVKNEDSSSEETSSSSDSTSTSSSSSDESSTHGDTSSPTGGAPRTSKKDPTASSSSDTSASSSSSSQEESDSSDEAPRRGGRGLRGGRGSRGAAARGRGRAAVKPEPRS